MFGDDEKVVKASMLSSFVLKGKGESIEGVHEDCGGGWRQVAPIEGGIGGAKEMG